VFDHFNCKFSYSCGRVQVIPVRYQPANTNMDTNDKTEENTASQAQVPSQGVDYDAEHGTLTSQKESSGVPDGGLEAWLVAAGAGCIFFAGLGFINSTGVFIEHYISHQLRGRSADDIAWIASLSSFLQFASGLVGGPLFDRYGAWVRFASCCLPCFFFFPNTVP
jgi:hypothetical protein